MESFIEYYIVGATLILWLGLSIWSVRWTYGKWHALFYPRAEATITQIKLIEESTISSSDGPDNHTQNILEVRYRFNVGGKVYSGSDTGGGWRFPGGSLWGKGDEQPLFEGKKTVGDTIPVFYDPANPANNTHRRYAFFGGVLTIVLVQLFLALAVNMIAS